jgi:hypothetical protein
MARIEVDTTLWPLVRVTLPPVVSDDEVSVYLDELRVLRERREPYALILDANQSSGFTAKQRQMQADYVRAGLGLSKRYMKAFAFVASSPWKRGMLTAIFWLSGTEWPHKVFSSFEQAKDWARGLVFQDTPGGTGKPS